MVKWCHLITKGLPGEVYKGVVINATKKREGEKESWKDWLREEGEREECKIRAGALHSHQSERG